MNRMIYKHVVVLGIDGAGGYIQQAVTPNFDKIFENGAVTYKALASNPTISAECWGSMIFGVAPEIHGLTNEIVSTREYSQNDEIPSLFQRIQRAMPNAKIGSYCDWNPITAGMIEKNVTVSTATARDSELTPMICDYIRSEKPNFLFIQFDSVDGVGHNKGYATEEYFERIGEVDILVGDVYKALDDAEMLEDTLFIVVTDHGGIDFMHGGWTDEEKYVTLALRGKSVRKTTISNANVRDISAIALYALGIEMPAYSEDGWTSQIPVGVFMDRIEETYYDVGGGEKKKMSVSKVQHTSEEVV